MNEQEIKNLLDKFDKGECTPAESAFIESWYNAIAKQAKAEVTLSELETKNLEIRRQLFVTSRKRIYPMYIRYAAAMIVIVGLAYGSYHIFTGIVPSKTDLEIVQEIHAGSNKAILTLSNGQKILLDSSQSGTIGNIPGGTITNNTNSGSVSYQIVNDNIPTTEALQVNSISTPAGGQYQLILPDGTHVFLNAASTLTFPSRFATNKREVNLVGEAYFEVAKDQNHPFLVNSKGQILKVLGTHFNISAYPNETLKTTLAEGKVEISQSANPQKTTLKPGDQSIVGPNGITVKQVEAEDAIAWKNGLFVFSNQSLKEVLKQLSRWYDVDVDYTSIPDQTIVGEIPRSMSLVKVLSTIEKLSHVQLSLEGRKIIKK